MEMAYDCSFYIPLNVYHFLPKENSNHKNKKIKKNHLSDPDINKVLILYWDECRTGSM